MGESLDELLCTEARRRIWDALRHGAEIYITPDHRAVDRITHEEYGNQIAAQVILFAGHAEWKPGADWVMRWRKRTAPQGRG